MGKLMNIAFGGAIGAAAALLLSPRNGEENRAIVAEGLSQARDRGEQIASRGREAVVDKVDQTTGSGAPSSEDIKAKINEVRDRIAEQVVNGKSTVREVEADVSDVAGEMVDEMNGAIDDPAEDTGRTTIY